MAKSHPGKHSRKRLFRWLAALLFAGAVASGGMWGLLWWQDRPLREAEAALQSKDYVRATRKADEYLREHPDSGRALSIKARAFAGRQRWQEVLRLFERVGAETPAELHAWASALLHHQRWGDAAPLLMRLLQLNPDDSDALHELTAAYSRMGYFEEALACAQRLAAQPEFSARGYLLLGTLHGDLGNDRRAVEAWRELLKRAPNAENLQVRPDEFFLAYGRALLNAGELREASRQLQRSREIKPGAENEAHLGRCFEQLGELALAADHWQAAIRFDPRQQAAREGLARLALGRKAPDEALAWLKPLLEASEMSGSTAYLAERVYTMLGDEQQTAHWRERTKLLRNKDERDAMIENGLKKAPYSFWSRAVRAYRFAESGNWYQAEQLIRKLLAESPDEPFVRELAEAVRFRGPLPSLDKIPMKRF